MISCYNPGNKIIHTHASLPGNQIKNGSLFKPYNLEFWSLFYLGFKNSHLFYFLQELLFINHRELVNNWIT